VAYKPVTHEYFEISGLKIIISIFFLLLYCLKHFNLLFLEHNLAVLILCIFKVFLEVFCLPVVNA